MHKRRRPYSTISWIKFGANIGLHDFKGVLRALEFYEGILFLTTNRVGAFDDAFISRVHIKLYYPDFSETERQRVWDTFVKKLTKERGDYMRVTVGAQEYIRESRQLREVSWNGREIRNGKTSSEYQAHQRLVLLTHCKKQHSRQRFHSPSSKTSRTAMEE